MKVLLKRLDDNLRYKFMIVSDFLFSTFQLAEAPISRPQVRGGTGQKAEAARGLPVFCCPKHQPAEVGRVGWRKVFLSC